MLHQRHDTPIVAPARPPATERDDHGEELRLIRRTEMLAKAREMRTSIDIVVTLLGELDEVSPEEEDTTVFQEMADLFRDIGEFSAKGAAASRDLLGRTEEAPE